MAQKATSRADALSAGKLKVQNFHPDFSTGQGATSFPLSVSLQSRLSDPAPGRAAANRDPRPASCNPLDPDQKDKYAEPQNVCAVFQATCI